MKIACQLLCILTGVMVSVLAPVLPAATQEDATMEQPTAVVSLGFEDVRWDFTSQGKYLLVEDEVRALRQFFHPWDISQDGDFASLSTQATVPADWEGPLYLNLYANDTYVTEGWEQVKPNWTHTYASYHVFVGHRFKQVLINDELIWEQDIGDAEDFGYFNLDISQHVKPGETFSLTLRALDKVGSGTKLPGDEFHLGIWSWNGLRDPEAEKKLYTRIFWGDVALSAGAPVAWEENPARKDIKLNPVRLAAAEPVELEAGYLKLDCPNGLPEAGYPVTWGIPFGEGKLFDKGHVALTDAAGQPVPLQTQVLHKWPDGSIHWLLLDFQASQANANRPYTVSYGTTVAGTPPPQDLQVSETEEAVTADTGALSFIVTKGARVLAEKITLDGEDEPLGQELTGELVTRDGWIHTGFITVNEEVVVEAAGPERATLLCSGHLVNEGKTFGRFTCRIHAYRGKPYLRVFFRIFNDTDVPAQLVEQFLLRLRTPMTDGKAVLGDQKLQTTAAETGRLLVRQHKCDAYEVFQGNDARRASGEHWEGPITIQTPEHGVSGQVRHFAQPRTIEYEQYVMPRGEAKRHELLLYFHKGSGEQAQVQAAFRAFEYPPVLMSPEWYADQQAFGRGAPLTPETFPGMHKYMIERGTPSLACTVPFGLRNWPDHYSDSIYSAYRGTWGNMYQEVDYGAYIIALLAGRREWLDYVEAYQRHFMDMDICHYHADAKWIGASFGIAPYHSGSRPSPLNAPLGGLFILHYLTGDPEARETAVGIADYLHAANVGVGSGSGRGVGWPLRSASIAYENTYDEKHLEIATKLAEFAMGVLVPRRQFFTQPLATWNYRGGGSGYNVRLAAGLMRYWRATGDERVGRAVASIAADFVYDWMSPTEPGILYGNDPLQAIYGFGYALEDVVGLFWGYELTGNELFLDRGAQMMRESILAERHNGAAFGLARYWETQDILYYYGLYKQQHPNG